MWRPHLREDDAVARCRRDAVDDVRNSFGEVTPSIWQLYSGLVRAYIMRQQRPESEGRTAMVSMSFAPL